MRRSIATGASRPLTIGPMSPAQPTTLLDLVNARRVAKVIRELPQSVVVVTHDLELLEGFERVVVLDGGRVVEDGPAEQSVPAYRKLMADR